MDITLQSLPFIFIGCIIIGIALIVISIFKISNTRANVAYLQEESGKQAQVEELFSYFLQEEEQKNQKFRQNLIREYQNIKDNKKVKQESKDNTEKVVNKKIKEEVNQTLERDRKVEDKKIEQEEDPLKVKEFNQVIEAYRQGKSIEEIAKKFKKGVGEVKLIISLYSMGE